jgi:hypothetical protein
MVCEKRYGSKSMTYWARYRFKLLSPLQIDKGRPLELAIPGFAAVTGADIKIGR